MKTCPNCHNAVDDSSLFCPKCGACCESVTPVPVGNTRRCKKCGKSVPSDVTFCPYCRAKLPPICDICGSEKKATAGGHYYCPVCQQRLAGEKENGNTESGGNANVKRFDGIAFSQDEKLVKKYKVAQVKLDGSTGSLYVTNKRVVFKSNGAAERSILSQEVKLDTISGVNCLVGTNYNIRSILLGALVIILGVIIGIILGNSRRGGSAGTTIITVSVLVGFLMIALSGTKTYRLSVYSSQAQSASIDIGVGVKSLIGNSAVLALECTPTDQVKTMVSEIGALILDLQTMGDLAIEKWKA